MTPADPFLTAGDLTYMVNHLDAAHRRAIHLHHTQGPHATTPDIIGRIKWLVDEYRNQLANHHLIYDTATSHPPKPS